MKKYFLTTILLLVMGAGNFNGLKAMARIDSLDNMDKNLEEMMKDMSPEEKKQVRDAMGVAKELQEKGITNNFTTGDALTIPQKQDRLLNEVSVLSSKQQYIDYVANLLTECKKHIQTSTIEAVDEYILKYSNDADAFVNIGPVLFLQRYPGAAIYAAIKTALSKPDNILLQDNLAVILHQSGYPQKALPILHYLLAQNNHPVILNNLGQSYLSLGDTANARKYFMGCLEKDPDHCESNCGMGLLLTEEGNISDATPYIIKSLKNGYTTTADELLQKHKIKIKFSDIKQKVPEYFNPQKYKPIPPAYTVEMVEPALAYRKELEEKMRLWMQKKEKINDEQRSKTDNESLLQLTDRNLGFLSNAPFAKKSQLMINLIGIEYSEFMAADDKNHYLAIEKEYYTQLEKDLAGFYSGSDNKDYKNEFEQCKKQIEVLTNYLEKSAKNHEAYQRKTLPNIYEWVNQSLYWWAFVSNEDQYKLYYHNFVSDFFEAMHGYDELQSLSPHGEYIAKNCKDVKEPPKVKTTDDSLSINCPVNVKADIKVGSYKLNCTGMELEVDKIIALNADKNFKTGEFTFAFGLGAGGALSFFEAGTKGQMFFKFDKNFSPIDCGMKFEAGGEVNVLGYTTEEKMTAVMGMTSGIHINAIDVGKTVNIFEMDPTK